MEERVMNRKSVITERQNVETAVDKGTSLVHVKLSVRRLIILQGKNHRKHISSYQVFIPVPHSLKPAVDSELDGLLSQGILEAVELSEWATPIVVVPKDSTVRMCGDFKVRLNQCIKLDQYPLPGVDEIFSDLSGGEQFTKLDLKNAL